VIFEPCAFRRNDAGRAPFFTPTIHQSEALKIMTQIIRVFDNPNRAKAAIDELKQRSLTHLELVPVSNGRDRSGNGGGAVVKVEAPFGTASTATEILNRHGGKTTPSAATEPARISPTPQQQTPSQPKSNPASSTTTSASSPHHGEGRLTAPRTLSEVLGIPELISSNTFFSGFPLLLHPTRSPHGGDQPRAEPRSGTETRSSNERAQSSAFVRRESPTARAVEKPEPVTLTDRRTAARR
jgi:hypothetical protein